MGIIKAFAQDLAEAMGLPDINQTVLEIGQSILDTKQFPKAQRGLQVARIARRIRKERFVYLCSWCLDIGIIKIKRNDVWEVAKSIPGGKRSHGICEECRDELVKESRTSVY